MAGVDEEFSHIGWTVFYQCFTRVRCLCWIL